MAGMFAAAGWRHCRRDSPNKKAVGGPLFPPRRRHSDLPVDLGHLAGVMMIGAAVKATGQQVVNHTRDRQHQEEEDQGAADVHPKPEQPEREEDDHDGPDQACQALTSSGMTVLVEGTLDIIAIQYHGSARMRCQVAEWP